MPSMAELSVGEDASAAPRARRFVAERLAGRLDATAQDAALVVTELVTNAALHGVAPVLVRVSEGAGTVRIEVEDGGQGVPVLPVQSTDAMTGRGLRLVAALSQSWGVERAGAGRKVVWAQLSQDPTATEDAAVPDIDVGALLASWSDEVGTEPTYTVRLGAVPTDLLLEAKAHIDNVVREARLAQGSLEHQPTAAEHASIEAVTLAFASARDQIKRQALAAAARGDVETTLVLTQPASAADAGERYLAALDQADQHSRHARLLTLEAPPVHKVFRRWYVQALVDQLRAEAAGRTAPAAPTFLQVLAGQMADVARLRDAEERLDLLQTIAAELTTAGTVEELCAVVVDGAASHLGALAGRVLLVDGDALTSVGVAVGSDVPYVSVPLSADLPGPVVVATRRSLVLRNLAQLAERFPALAGLYDSDRTLHVAPLVVGDHVLGVLSLTFPPSGRLDPDTQARFVRALADALAQALERAQTMEAVRAANERLAFVADASVALGADLDFDATVAAVEQLLLPRLADWCVVQVLQDGALQTVGIRHADPAKLAWAQQLAGLYPTDMDADTGAAQVLRTGRSQLFADIPDELVTASARSPEHLAALRQLGMSSVVIVPMTGRSGTVGTISLIYAESGRHYEDADLPFVEDVARRAALALETAQLVRSQSGRLAAVTRVAEAAQQAILAPPPPRLGPVALAGRYVSATAEALVGGDLFEVVARPGAVRLLIGDVRGKGLPAVRTATVVLGEFRAAAADLEDLPEIARQIDRRLRPYLGAEDFVTALIAEIADDGSFTVVSCGHPPALHATATSVTAVACTPALPLGLGAAPVVTGGRLAPGDRLLMMTDGIVEARRPDGEFVDLTALVRPLRSGSLEDCLDVLLHDLRDAVGCELADDLALLVAEYGG